MGSRVLSGPLFWGFCLLLVHHAVQGKTMPIDKFLVQSHWKTTSQIGRKSEHQGVVATEVSIPDDDDSDIRRHYAIFKTEPYQYGFHAAISAYSLPQVKAGQSSASEIWVISGLGGPDDQVSTVQAGWHVRPSLYNDTLTHLFTYWTADNYKSTGCYNLRCPGFVLNPDSKIHPGIVLNPLSTINGEQYEIMLSITKDFETGDWLLKLENGVKIILIGHWPKSMFPNQRLYADEIHWGGLAITPSSLPGPPMGSGRYPVEGANNASYFRNIQLYNSFGFTDIEVEEIAHKIDANCYDIQSISHADGKIEKTYYGGPGGCT